MDRCIMIGGNAALDRYIRKSRGITRGGLNLLCGLGFIIPLIMPMAFEHLRKELVGLVWFLIAVAFGASGLTQGQPGLIVLGYISLVGAWIHANLILSRYESGARMRIAEIGVLAGEGLTTDNLLEKALLQHKVLHERSAALDTLGQVLTSGGGDSDLLNRGGVLFWLEGKFAEAKELFVRALAGARDAESRKQMQQNITTMDEALERASRGDLPPKG